MTGKPTGPRPTVPLPGGPARGASAGQGVGALLTAAMTHHKAGRWREAEAGYRRVLSINPSAPDALHMLGVLALQMGNPAAALPWLERAVAVRGNHAESLANLGSAYLMLGRREKGVAALERALSVSPSHVQAHYNLGGARLEAGDLAAAKRHLELALTLEPRYADAHNSLGIVMSQEADHEAAERSFRKTLELAPEHPRATQNLGGALVKQERFEEALEQFERLVRLEPTNPAAHFHLAFTHAKLNQNAQARDCYERALEIEPDYLDAHNNLGSLLLRWGEPKKALEHFEVANRLRPNNRFILKNLAKTLLEMNLHDRAGATFRGIIALDDGGVADAYAGLVMTLHEQGRFQDSARVIEEFRERSPDPLAMVSLKVVDRSYRPSEAEMQTIVEAIGKADKDSSRLPFLCFAAGHHYDRAGEHEKAFGYFSRANSLRDQEYDYDPDAAEDRLEGLRALYTPELFAEKAGLGDLSRCPIFIFGMPRSGTTLTEQILASHPDVGGAGEQSKLGEVIRELPALAGLDDDSAQAVRRLTAELAQTVARRYLDHVEGLLPGYPRITDKMPGNYNHLGLISILLPKATLIHCRRDPFDTCLSIFFTNFSGSHPYAYDLYRLGRHYRTYERLMAFWRTVLPTPILDVVYEETVADQESASRKILEACGLDWHDRVLDFHHTDRAIKTASLWQVRQPIYRTSVARWKAYEKFLEPLERGLRGEPP